MDFTLGVITGIYGAIALIIFYIVYIIEVKLDIPYANSENGEYRGVSHIRLRQLIECIVAETLKLPSRGASAEANIDSTQQVITANNNETGQYFAPKSYQELLATAVLNKIVDTHGKGRVLLSESSPNLSSGYDKNHNAVHKQSTTSSESSSIEPRSETSCTETDKLLNKEMKKYNSLSPCESYSNLIIDELDTGRTSMLSDYIASHMVPLPDISGAATAVTEIDSDDEDDNLSQTSNVSHDNTWENNWLFKKKHNRGKMTSANSVGMLVPAPKDDIRAQIGDKTADEMSDLSEAGSDSEESSSSSLLDYVKSATIDPLNDRLLNKHLIGGKNTADALDEILDQASLISSSSLPDYEPLYKETLNENVKGIDSIASNTKNSQSKVSSMRKAKAVNGSTTKHDLQGNPPNSDGIVPNNEPIIPPPIDFSDDDEGSVVNGEVNDTYKRSNGNTADSDDDDGEHSALSSSLSGPLSGSIAEREYQKWYNAVEMPNNPYSPEALKRRLSTSSERFIDLPNINQTSQSSPVQITTSNQSDNGELNKQRDYQRYSRDYYINDAKYSSGMKKRSSESAPNAKTSVHGATGTLKENLNPDEGERIPSPIVRDLFPTSEAQADVYLAKPAIVEEDSIEMFQTTPSSTNNSSLTQSDDSDTIRIYNLNKQETIILREKSSNHSRKSPHPLITEVPTTPTAITSTPTKSHQTFRPIDLPIDFANSIQGSPTKGSTPTSLKFLQPKRKLIEPNQVLSIDGEKPLVTQIPFEKKVIEEDVVHALPSVKALAQTFLKSCNKTKHNETHWNRPTQRRTKSSKASVNKNNLRKKTTKPKIIIESTTSQGSADDATIASDLSSLETDPSSTQDPKYERPVSPVLIPSGFLKNNIAFFENLKNK